MKKKSQVQMGESIAIIIIVTILIVFGFIFYSKVKEQTISEKQTLFKELDVVELAQIASSLPEIQCSFVEVSDSSCFDILKIEALSKIVEDSFTGTDKTAFYYYREIFGRGEVSIEELKLNNIRNWTIYKTDNSSLSINQVNIPVSLYNPLTGENSFGILIVKKYT